jgi:tetratricopeptide (TPR) repeat protein
MNPALPTGLAFLLAALPGANGKALEEAARAFQDGAYARVLELTATIDPASADAPRLNYLAGEAQLALDAPAAAEAAFRAVLAERPRAVPAQVGLGRALAALQRNDEALAALEAALRADPDDVGALSAHGLLLSTTGHGKEARAELARAWKRAPTSPLVVRAHVEVLLRSGENPEAAAVVEAFEQARPEHPLGPFLLAWTMERDGEDEQAIEQYRTALERDPDFIDAHKNLAILCHTLSNTYQDKERVLLAYAHYERYFALGGRDPGLRSMYDSLVSFKQQILGG